ncbi:hypothetical protein AN958_02681 [Leucoagaricus sp. SymC.cos]|nr:hypothetical protein AN958_02681 [Leucoagaricus sp. SymC.cos]
MKKFQFSFIKPKNKRDEGTSVASKRSKPPPDLGFVTLHRNFIHGVEARSPTLNPARCHPETRKSLRGKIVTWLQDDLDPIKGAFFVTGPACVGKTVVIQTISDDCYQEGWIGATLFLSSANRLDDNSKIIATISNQLAQKSIAFMDSVAEALKNDPELFERRLQLQFIKLIVEPSKVFRPRIIFKKPKPLVIILDGLDQCMNTSSQVELLQLIDDYIRQPSYRCPFKWIISGRPVARWLNVVTKPGHQHTEISFQDAGAIEEVNSYIIRAGIRDIRTQHFQAFREESGGKDWPPESMVAKMEKWVSGSFMVASCMLDFIADQARRDPKGQLQRCLEFINDGHGPRENNPLSPLFLVYQQILSSIDPDTLARTMCILQLLAVKSGNRVFDADNLAESLNMEISVLYRALEGLQPVLKISSYDSRPRNIEFYHTSFLDFLRHRVDPSRAKSLSYIQEVSTSRSTEDSSDIALAILLPNVLEGAEFDSPSRYPPPRCHPRTRTLLRQKTGIWLMDATSVQRILWITGPVGVGKSAIGQSLAEQYHQIARLGASIFFSRSLHGNEVVQKVVPTLACQLAAQFPEYRALITTSLLADPSVLEKDLRSQFQEFIVNPLQELQTEQLLYSPQNPLVIILDGLDACGTKVAQVELMRLIGEFSKHKYAASGLLWIICSRPESHVKKMIWRMTLQNICRHEELLVEDGEAKDDVELMLRDRFYEIRKQYYFRFGPTETWPNDIHWHFMKVTSSGFFKFASCILEYVADEDQRDPRALLELCFGLVNSPLIPHTLHPFRSLDALYEQVLDSVPPDTLSTTLRILSLCVHASDKGLLVRDAVAFLNIDRRSLDHALDNLHSVIDFSFPGTENERLGFYHHSFADFLRDPKRSGEIAKEINMETEPRPERQGTSQPQASSSKVTLDAPGKEAVVVQSSATALDAPRKEAVVAQSSATALDTPAKRKEDEIEVVDRVQD